MNLTHSCIVTDNMKKLVEFYRQVLQITPELYGQDYAEFEVGRGILAILDVTAHEILAPCSVKPATNRSVILEFNVVDVDREFERLSRMGVDWVKTPTTQPWGNRSILFRDPDGNLINFYTRVAG